MHLELQEMKEDASKEKGESSDHVTLKITESEQEFKNLTSSIRERLDAISFPCSIYFVPTKFHTQNEEAYQPIMISIGPIHHGKARLIPMENHKWEYLNALMSRGISLDSTLDSCIKALKELEPKIRACYQGEFSLESDEFVSMMLLDGGFIIELFLRYAIRGLRRKDDQFFRTPEKFYSLRNDLFLLENQIPFFVLRKIFSLVQLPKQCDRSISQLSLRFFKNLIPGDVELLQEKYNFEGSSHLLDLIWKCYLPSSSKVPMSTGSDFGRTLHSASKLQEAGIKVKMAETESILDVKFVKGALAIPSFKIHNHMETLFRNLIAMEHCHGEKMKHVTSYAYQMKGLIHSVNDVTLLYRRGILDSYVQKKEDIVNLFKMLCEDEELDKFYYEGMWEQINGYGRTRWEVWRYKFKHKYKEIHCRRLSGASVGVAMLIFVLIWILFIVLYVFIRRKHS